MKNTLLLLLVSSTISMAATINIGNLNGPDDSNGITLLNGTLITTGSAQVGYFDGVADVGSATLSTLVGAFTPYGNIIGFGAGLDAAALFSGSVNGPTINGTNFVGQALYLMVTAPALTPEYLIWNPNISFPASEPFASTVNVQQGQGSLVQGGFNNSTITFGDFGGTVAVPAFNTVPIPEPSAALLGALGALGLLRRRRI